MILTIKGFNAKAFASPLKALEEASADPPDLLLSDVMMPELSGIDLAVKLRKRYPNCKVLLFSGQAATADLLREAREKGHEFHVLAKPVHPDDLLAEIHRTMT